LRCACIALFSAVSREVPLDDIDQNIEPLISAVLSLGQLPLSFSQPVDPFVGALHGIGHLVKPFLGSAREIFHETAGTKQKVAQLSNLLGVAVDRRRHRSLMVSQKLYLPLNALKTLLGIHTYILTQTFATAKARERRS
jgi:hypothetical protein